MTDLSRTQRSTHSGRTDAGWGWLPLPLPCFSCSLLWADVGEPELPVPRGHREHREAPQSQLPRFPECRGGKSLDQPTPTRAECWKELGGLGRATATQEDGGVPGPTQATPGTVAPACTCTVTWGAGSILGSSDPSNHQTLFRGSNGLEQGGQRHDGPQCCCGAASTPARERARLAQKACEVPGLLLEARGTGASGLSGFG